LHILISKRFCNAKLSQNINWHFLREETIANCLQTYLSLKYSLHLNYLVSYFFFNAKRNFGKIGNLREID